MNDIRGHTFGRLTAVRVNHQWASHEAPRVLAVRYGIGVKSIYAIRERLRWLHL